MYYKKIITIKNIYKKWNNNNKPNSTTPYKIIKNINKIKIIGEVKIYTWINNK